MSTILKNKKIIILSLNSLIFFSILLFPYGDFSYIKIFASIICLFNIPGFLLLKYLNCYKKKENLFTIFISSFIVGFPIWLVLLFTSSLLKISIHLNVIKIITLITLFIAGFGIVKDIIKSQSNTIIRISKEDLILITLFNILLFVFIYPTRGLIVAPLHDPAAISIFARSLIENNYIFTNLPNINLFYPPGGYYLVALISDFAQFDPSTTTMIVTNICNVLTGFSFAILLKTIFGLKNISWISVLVFSVISIYPASLYFAAGKNAQVIAFVFLFGSSYFFYKAVGGKFLLKVIFGLVFFASILIHYNNLLISSILFLSIYFYKLLKIQSKKKFLKKDLLQWFLIIIPVLSLFFFQFSIIRNTPYFQSSILRPLESDEKFIGIISIFEFFKWFISEDIEHINSINSFNILLLGLVSYFFLILRLTNSWLKERKIDRMIIFCILIVLLYYSSLYIEIGAITRYFELNRLIPFLITITLALTVIFNKKITIFNRINLNVFLIILFTIVGYNNITYIYNSYIRAQTLSVVKEEDLEAFEWINTNLEDTKFIIPAHIKLRYRFNLDSSLYLKAYTNNYDLFGFVRGQIPENQSELASSYRKLKNNPQDRVALEEFTSSNIHYVFSGSHKPWGCGELPCDYFDLYPEIYEVVYDKDGVQIYKINLDN